MLTAAQIKAIADAVAADYTANKDVWSNASAFEVFSRVSGVVGAVRVEPSAFAYNPDFVAAPTHTAPTPAVVSVPIPAPLTAGEVSIGGVEYEETLIPVDASDTSSSGVGLGASRVETVTL